MQEERNSKYNQCLDLNMDSVGPNRLSGWLYFELSDSLQFARFCIFSFLCVLIAATVFKNVFCFQLFFSLPALQIYQKAFTE